MWDLFIAFIKVLRVIIQHPADGDKSGIDGGQTVYYYLYLKKKSNIEVGYSSKGQVGEADAGKPTFDDLCMSGQPCTFLPTNWASPSLAISISTAPFLPVIVLSGKPFSTSTCTNFAIQVLQ